MDDKFVTLADAKARLSELTELAAGGEDIIITKRGRPVARITRQETPRKAVDFETLRRLTAGLPPQAEASGDFIRRLRDGERY